MHEYQALASKLPKEKLTSEFNAVLASYGQQVDYVDFESLVESRKLHCSYAPGLPS